MWAVAPWGKAGHAMDPAEFNPLELAARKPTSTDVNAGDTLAAFDRCRKTLPATLSPDQERAALEALFGGPVHPRCLTAVAVSAVPQASSLKPQARRSKHG